MKKVLFGIMTLALITGTACKKSKDKPAITKENLAGTYKISAATMKMGSSPEVDMLTQMDACQKDDEVKLNLDGSFVVTDAGTQCDPPGDYSDVWSLSGTQITIDGETGTVTNFDGTYLEVTGEFSDSGITFVMKTTYKKQ
jgi:hypothetical protein